jgi:hypothetical protein
VGCHPLWLSMALALSSSMAGWKGLTKKSSAPARRAASRSTGGVVGRHDEYRDGGQAGIGTDPGADGVAVDAGHLDVKHDQVGPDGNSLGERVGAVPSGDDLKAFQAEVEFDQAKDVGVIVGHKHGSGQRASLS